MAIKNNNLWQRNQESAQIVMQTSVLALFAFNASRWSCFNWYHGVLISNSFIKNNKRWQQNEKVVLRDYLIIKLVLVSELFIDENRICVLGATKSLKCLPFFHQIFVSFFHKTPAVKKTISVDSVRFLEKTWRVSSPGKQKYQVTKLA